MYQSETHEIKAVNNQHTHTTHFASSGQYSYEPRKTHDFASHADVMLGADVMAANQGQ